MGQIDRLALDALAADAAYITSVLKFFQIHIFLLISPASVLGYIYLIVYGIILLYIPRF